MRYDPFDENEFVPATVCGLACQYEIRQALRGGRPDRYRVVKTWAGGSQRLLGSGLTWMQAMREVAMIVEAEIAPEEGRPMEDL